MQQMTPTNQAAEAAPSQPVGVGRKCYTAAYFYLPRDSSPETLIINMSVTLTQNQ